MKRGGSAQDREHEKRGAKEAKKQPSPSMNGCHRRKDPLREGKLRKNGDRGTKRGRRGARKFLPEPN